MGYYRRIGFGDLPFFQLAWDDLLDLVFEAECNLCDVGWRKGGRREVGAAGGEDWRVEDLDGRDWKAKGWEDIR